jgi:hypothetical protein
MLCIISVHFYRAFAFGQSCRRHNSQLLQMSCDIFLLRSLKKDKALDNTLTLLYKMITAVLPRVGTDMYIDQLETYTH